MTKGFEYGLQWVDLIWLANQGDIKDLKKNDKICNKNLNYMIVLSINNKTNHWFWLRDDWDLIIKRNKVSNSNIETTKMTASQKNSFKYLIKIHTYRYNENNRRLEIRIRL